MTKLPKLKRAIAKMKRAKVLTLGPSYFVEVVSDTTSVGWPPRTISAIYPSHPFAHFRSRCLYSEAAQRLISSGIV